MLIGSQTTAFSVTAEPVGATVAGADVTNPTAVSDAVNLSVVSTEMTTDPELQLLETVGEGNGLNLSDVAVADLAPLALNKNGEARPAAGPWNVGPF
jgi:hypothetical protein